MAGAELVLDLRIILRALIGILDQQRNRRSRRHLFTGVIVHHHAGQDLDRVGLLPLRGEARLSRTAAIEIALDFVNPERNPRRAAVDHAADRRPMALAEGRDAEKLAEGVE